MSYSDSDDFEPDNLPRVSKLKKKKKSKDNKPGKAHTSTQSDVPSVETSMANG